MADSTPGFDEVKLTVRPAEPSEFVVHYDLAIHGSPLLALWVLIKLAATGKFPKRILIVTKE